MILIVKEFDTYFANEGTGLGSARSSHAKLFGRSALRVLDSAAGGMS